MRAKRHVYLVRYQFKGREWNAAVFAYTKTNAAAIIREYYDFDGCSRILECKRAAYEDICGLGDSRVWHCSRILAPINEHVLDYVKKDIGRNCNDHSKS